MMANTSLLQMLQSQENIEEFCFGKMKNELCGSRIFRISPKFESVKFSRRMTFSHYNRVSEQQT